jgi:hypothetical protein
MTEINNYSNKNEFIIIKSYKYDDENLKLSKIIID